MRRFRTSPSRTATEAPALTTTQLYPEPSSDFESRGRYASKQLRFVTDDVAIIAYTVNETVILDGRTFPLSPNDASVQMRGGGAPHPGAPLFSPTHAQLPNPIALLTLMRPFP